jgi:enoyl-CoA hydratase/carnithine racemase
MSQVNSAILTRNDHGPIALLRMNRPDKLNALSNALLFAIVRAQRHWPRCRDDPGRRATGAAAASRAVQFYSTTAIISISTIASG